MEDAADLDGMIAGACVHEGQITTGRVAGLPALLLWGIGAKSGQPRVTRAAAVALAIVAILAGCGGTAGTRTPGLAASAAEITVTLGIYSGRPDPSWSLGGAQPAVLLQMIDDLPVAAGVPPEGGLGYHGFSLVVHVAGQADRYLVAYRGALAEPGAGPRDFRADPARTIERYLLATGRVHLTAAEVAAVEVDLGAP